MVHQAHNIPWHSLASHTEVHFHRGDRRRRPANIYLANKPGQTDNIKYFISQFTKCIEQQTLEERRKYAETVETPQPEDVVLDDRILKRITKTVERGRFRYGCSPQWIGVDRAWFQIDEPSSKGKCKHAYYSDDICQCVIPSYYHRMEAFMLNPVYRPSRGYFHAANINLMSFSAEIQQCLLLYGEMDTLFKIYSRPYNHSLDYQVYRILSVYEVALHSYICLNLLDYLSDRWQELVKLDDRCDYRRLKKFQELFIMCTGAKEYSEMHTFPHRDFFGVDADQLCCAQCDHLGSSNRGYISFYEFLRKRSVGIVPYQTDPQTLEYVQIYLQKKGLPLEIRLDIMERAQLLQKTRHKLSVAYDPLHFDNREELSKYLKYCWLTILRVNMLVQTTGIVFNWEEQVARAVAWCFDITQKRMASYGFPEDWFFALPSH